MFLVVSINDGRVYRSRHDTFKEAEDQAKEDINAGCENVRITIIVREWLNKVEVYPHNQQPVS